jgi:hypothetical protein
LSLPSEQQKIDKLTTTISQLQQKIDHLTKNQEFYQKVEQKKVMFGSSKKTKIHSNIVLINGFQK